MLLGEKFSPPLPTAMVVTPEVEDVVVEAGAEEEAVELEVDPLSPYWARTAGRSERRSAEVYIMRI